MTVCFTVETDGSVTNVRVTNTKFWTMNGRTPGHLAENDLKKEAVREIEQSTFVPRRINGKAVTMHLACTPIKFGLG